MPIYKQCSKCGKKIEQYKQCECMIQARKDSYKRYKDRRRMNEQQSKQQDFYCSKEWLRLRDIIIADCFGLDIVLWYKDGTVESGYTVHHIIELSEDWDSRLDVNNLIYVTEQTHQLIHAEYNKGERQKKAMQMVLFNLLDKFNKEFNNKEKTNTIESYIKL